MKNRSHKIALSGLRMSSHSPMIEKGRHFKPYRAERKCLFCKNKIEDEYHFIATYLPLVQPDRKPLESACRENCVRYDSLTQEQKFVFVRRMKMIRLSLN